VIHRLPPAMDSRGGGLNAIRSGMTGRKAGEERITHNRAPLLRVLFLTESKRDELFMLLMSVIGTIKQTAGRATVKI
jgi:hypothetical protein